METKVVRIENIKLCENELIQAAKAIKEGGIVAFPTETVYGLGANALDEEAVKKIFKAKGRPQDNPLIIHVSDYAVEEYVTNIPSIARRIMDRFWPGPITIILKKKAIVPNITSANLPTVGIRMPNDPIALELIKKSGVPIAAPSANISGKPSPTEIERCIEDLYGKVDFIIGGSKSNVGVESTIIDCTVTPPVILRPGGVTLEMLRKLDERIYIDTGIINNDSNIKPKAPGMKYKHYAPNGQITIIKGNDLNRKKKISELFDKYKSEGKKVIILTTNNRLNKYKNSDIINLGNIDNPNTIAQNLFEALRKCDDAKADIILCEAIDENGIGVAIMNRLKKAAAYNICEV